MTEQINYLDIWKTVKKIIKTRIHSQSYLSWIQPTKPIGIDNETLIIETRDEIMTSWNEEHYLRLLEEILQGLNTPLKKINFVASHTIVQASAEELEINYRNYSSYSIELNEKFRFDSFVIGDSNKFAFTYSEIVAKNPGQKYNPFFIYGKTGLGKTHLMQAIANHIFSENSNARISYATAESFTNEYISCLGKTGNLSNFQQKYRFNDVLLIDDVQFFEKTERIQEEFFHTFNTLYSHNKQIVLTSDSPPNEIKIESRLVSRFQSGLSIEINKPSFETRVAILKNKAKIDKFEVPENVLMYIAENVTSNIRELEGCLLKIQAISSFQNIEINLDMAKEALKDIVTITKSNLTLDYIINVISKYFEVTKAILRSNKRAQKIAIPRQIAMYFCRKLTKASLTEIGEKFNRDHSTVIHAIDKIDEKINEDEGIKEHIEIINRKLTEDY